MATIRDFLSPPVRQLVEDLRSESGVETIEISGGDFQVISGGSVDSEEKLVRFGSLSLRLAQHAWVFCEQAPGVQFEEGSRFTGECQVCGAALEGELLICEKCRTPHHRDCWEYTGMCSIYGCGGRSGR